MFRKNQRKKYSNPSTGRNGLSKKDPWFPRNVLMELVQGRWYIKNPRGHPLSASVSFLFHLMIALLFGLVQLFDLNPWWRGQVLTTFRGSPSTILPSNLTIEIIKYNCHFNSEEPWVTHCTFQSKIISRTARSLGIVFSRKLSFKD